MVKWFYKSVPVTLTSKDPPAQPRPSPALRCDLRAPLPPPSPASALATLSRPGAGRAWRRVSRVGSFVVMAKITSSRLDDEQSIFAFFDSQYKFAWCNGARNGAMVPFRKKTPDCAGQRCSVEDDDVDSKRNSRCYSQSVCQTKAKRTGPS